jgi:hypothetical protein
MEKAMQKAIAKIIRNIPRQRIFDSHFVIDQLIKHHSDVYLRFAFKFAGSVMSSVNLTAQVHGLIAQEVDKRAQQLSIERILSSDNRPERSWSETIHGEPGECACWRKI